MKRLSLAAVLAVLVAVGAYAADSAMEHVNGSASSAFSPVSQSDLATAIGSIGSGNAAGSALTAPCTPANTTGLVYAVPACNYVIQGVALTSAATTVTLTAADATNPRIDTLILKSDGTADKVTGTAATNPTEPSLDPATELKIANVTVAANATTPTGLSNESVYAENTEWTVTTGTVYVDDVGFQTSTGALTLQQLDARYPQIANNLSDLASAATARTNLGLGTAATKNMTGANGKCLEADASGNIVTAASDAACGSGAGGSKPFISWSANQAILPASGFPQFSTRNSHAVLAYDQDADECAYFEGILSGSYAGGGLTLSVDFISTSDTSNTHAVGWLGAIERHDSGTDIDADSFASDRSVSTTITSTAGNTVRSTITFSSGAQMDSLAAGEGFRVRLCRDGDGSVVTDSMTGDAGLTHVALGES